MKFSKLKIDFSGLKNSKGIKKRDVVEDFLMAFFVLFFFGILVLGLILLIIGEAISLFTSQ